jgi:hypothetical protein
MSPISFYVIITLAVITEARTCYECYDKEECKKPATIICPSETYGCGTSILDIEPYVSKVNKIDFINAFFRAVFPMTKARLN